MLLKAIAFELNCIESGKSIFRTIPLIPPNCYSGFTEFYIKITPILAELLSKIIKPTCNLSILTNFLSEF
jgi:hypothetical protein